MISSTLRTHPFSYGVVMRRRLDVIITVSLCASIFIMMLFKNLVLEDAIGDDVQKQWYQIELRPFDDEEDRDDQPVESK